MTARERWLQGLQWGACVCLGRVAWWVGVSMYDVPPGNPLLRLPGLHDLREQMALAWLVAIALIVAGSGWSRVAVGAGILIKVVEDCICGRGFDEITPSVVLGVFLSVSPLLPLVVLRVREPRLVLALLALGRWREALARSGGWRTALIAAAVVSVNRGVEAAFASCPDRWPHRFTKVLVDLGCEHPYVWTGALLPVLLFALAALATWAAPERMTKIRTSW